MEVEPVSETLWFQPNIRQWRILIIGLCILLREYQLNTGRTSVSNKVFFSARFYCALLTLYVSAPFSGHLIFLDFRF
jgi:hypothetical protein